MARPSQLTTNFEEHFGLQEGTFWKLPTESTSRFYFQFPCEHDESAESERANSHSAVHVHQKLPCEESSTHLPTCPTEGSVVTNP